MDGTVSNVISAKKFGFITGENGQEYFFHLTDMETSWDDLEKEFHLLGGSGKVKVTFEPSKTPKGPRAKNVAMLDF